MNTKSTMPSSAFALPEISDDYVQTPAGEPVVVYPLGVEVDLAARDWDLILLNDPRGGVATVTSAGAVKFAPTPSFVGAATIHFLIEDQQGNDSSATITVEVQNQFAFDIATSANNGTTGARSHFEASESETGICAQKVFAVVADPVFAGSAATNAELFGRIYNQSGALAGESMVTADIDGQWEMVFPETRALEFYRVEFEQLALASGASGKIALKPDEASWQMM